MNLVSKVTGFSHLPPIEYLGFHFSKWAEVSTKIMTERDDDFESKGFPVDVYWMDIQHAENYKYFQFDHRKFPQDKLALMNQQIENRKRRMVVITDPHIKAVNDNFVYKNAVELESTDTP